SRDWSSDVCSSDLAVVAEHQHLAGAAQAVAMPGGFEQVLDAAVAQARPFHRAGATDQRHREDGQPAGLQRAADLAETGGIVGHVLEHLGGGEQVEAGDRKSTRLNSSHVKSSY